MGDFVDPGQVGLNIFNAFRAGQETAKQERYQNALATYATNPNDQTLNALAPYNPEMVMQQRTAQQQAQQQQQHDAQTQRRADLPILARLLDHAATGPEGYQQAIQAAQSYGIDVSHAPASWEQGGQQFVAEQKALMEVMQDPQKMTSTMQEVMASLPPEHRDPNDPVFIQAMHGALMKTIPYQAGGGVAAFDPNTQQVTPLVVPNDGGHAAGEPVKNIPRITTPDEAAKLPPGTQFYDPHGVLRMVPGGGAGNSAGHFPNLSRYYGQ